MSFKQKLSKLGEWILLIYMLLEATLAGGAHYLAETGEHLHGFLWEELPSIGLGLVSPLSAAIIAFKLLASWRDLPRYLKITLLVLYVYWFLAWIPFIAGYFLAHSHLLPGGTHGITYQEIYKIYFPSNWRLVTVIGLLNIVSANTIMLPAMLAAMFSDQIISARQQEATQQAQLEAEQLNQARSRQEFLRDAGLWPSRIMSYFDQLPLNEGRTCQNLADEFEVDRMKIYPHLRKLEEAGYVYSTQGEGREKIYYKDVK